MTPQEISIFRWYFVLSAITMFLLICFFGIAQSSQVDTSKVVIHHTHSHDVSWKIIDKWHKERGWDGIGYHFVIRTNGDIENGRALSKLGAHKKGHNHKVGIALTGYDDFTIYQLRSLRRLLRKLGAIEIERHHENCPGNGLNVEEL